MTENRPIYWNEGLFLRPQHFQQHDEYFHNRLRELSTNTNPYYWGVVRCTIQESRLNNQILNLEEAELVFQDGTHVILGKNAQIENRSFEECWGSRGDTMGVYVGLRLPIKRENNLTQYDAKLDDARKIYTTKRYAANPVTAIISDQFQSESQEEISYLDFKLQLFFGDEALNAVDFNLLKVAEVKRSGSEVRLVSDYVPPSVRVGASSTLRKQLKDVREKLISRSRELSLYKEDRMGDLNQLSGRDLVYLLALRALNRLTPRLHHLLEQDDVPPFTIYLLLQEMIGDLSSFSTTYDLFGLDVSEDSDPAEVRYDHENLYKLFNRSIVTIASLLDEITAGPDYVSSLYFDGTYYYSDLDERIFSGLNQYFLCVRTQLPEDYIVSAISQLAKVSSRELLPLLIARSLAGVIPEYLASPPTALPRRSGNYYFHLDPSGDAWSALKEGRNIAVYMDNPPADIEFELMVISGK